MRRFVRFSVSIEPELLEQLDRFCDVGVVANRSEILRRLVREKLDGTPERTESTLTVATLTLVYDLECARLTSQVLDAQHERLDLVVSTTRAYLTHDACLEVIILRGGACDLERFAKRICSLKGVRSGQLVVAAPCGEPPFEANVRSDRRKPNGHV